MLSLLLLLCTLATTQVIGQQREIKKEDRYYYLDSEGKKKYISNSKTQKMWSEILEKYPQAIDIAEKYNVNIFQNKKYQKPPRKEESASE